MIEQNNTPFREVNRFQQVSLILSDIHLSIHSKQKSNLA